MGWVKLEDTFAEHPKVELAGDEAAWLYVSGLLYAYRADTDGFVPSAKVSKLTGFRGSLKLAERLVEVGLWESVEDGYTIHDYLLHQQSSFEREEQRQANADRARRAREKKRARNADVTALQERTQRVSNADVTSTEGEGEGEVLPTTSSEGPDLPVLRRRTGERNVVAIERATNGEAA